MTGYPTPTFDALTLTAPLSPDNGGTGRTTGAAASGANSDITSLNGLTTAITIAQGGTGATTEAAARAALGAQPNGSDGTNTTALAVNTTLTAAQSGTTFRTDGFTAAGSITLPANAAGLNFVIYGNASYAITVTAITSNIVLPDGTAAANYVLPLSINDAVLLFADGTNWRAHTIGRNVVAPAVNANEAVQLGKVKNAVAPVAGNANPQSGTTGVVTTGTLTAPCNGYALVVASFSSFTGSLNGTSVTASLSGLVQSMNPDAGNYFNQSVWYLPMTTGQSSTFTATLSQTTSGVATVTCIATFQPNPGT